MSQEIALPFTVQSIGATYICRSKIGTGATGDIYKTDCNHALKLIPCSSISPEEMYILTNVHHAHIIRALDFGVTQAKLSTTKPGYRPFYYNFFVMPLGVQTLYEMDLNIVPFAQRIKWIRQIYSALRHLYTLGHIHGDIHPKNVLLMPNDDVVLIDFNLSYHIMDEDVSKSPTSTVPFCSPLSLLASSKPETNKMYTKLLKGCTEPIGLKDQLKCDSFAFAQLVTYILFNGESFMHPVHTIDTVVFIEQYTANMVAYNSLGSQYVYDYLQAMFEKYRIGDQLLFYCSNCCTSLNLLGLFHLLINCLRFKQSDRMMIGLAPMLDVILSW